MGRNRHARNGGVRLAYELRGRLRRRRPWLVLIQGLGFDRTGWDPVARQLQRHFQLVLIDNRGSGRSTVPTDSFTVGHMAADVAAVLDAARIPRTHVVGVSLGGMVAQEFAVDHPERVDRLVLASTTPGWPYAFGMPAGSVQLMAETPRLPAAVAVRRHVENSLSARTVEERPDLVERLVRHQLSHPSDPAAWAALAAAGASYAGALRQTRIQAPTLVLHGSADEVVDPRNGALLAARIPRARLVMLPDLGHLSFWENPEAFVEAVATFLLERGSDDQLDTP